MVGKLERAGLGVGVLAIGLALIGLGFLFLLGQVLDLFFGIHLARFLWPLFIIVPGAVLFAFGLGSPGGAGQGLSIAGSVITSLGTLLFFQNLTGLWANWAYTWALVAPTSVGLGLAIWGTLKGHPDAVQKGVRLAGIGFAIFLVLGIFFELIIGLSSFGLFRLGRTCWPVLLIMLGGLLLVGGLAFSRRKGQSDV